MKEPFKEENIDIIMYTLVVVLPAYFNLLTLVSIKVLKAR